MADVLFGFASCVFDTFAHMDSPENKINFDKCRWVRNKWDVVILLRNYILLSSASALVRCSGVSGIGKSHSSSISISVLRSKPWPLLAF